MKEYILYDSTFHKTWENENKSTVTERSMVAWGLDGWQVEAEGMDYVHEETIESDGYRYVYYFDCGKGFIHIYIRQNFSNWILYIGIVYYRSITPQYSFRKQMINNTEKINVWIIQQLGYRWKELMK